jgi:uridine kinase
MRAYQFITEAQDSDAVNELDLFIMNDEELYRRRFMPIITNIKRKIKRGIYDHKKVIKMWMYLVDDAARKYVQEFGGPEQDVKDMFPKETRLQVAQVIADREKENIEKGEYDVVKGTVSPRG